MIQRYFKDDSFTKIKEDFNFLLKLVKNFGGDLDFAIRENYFNLYYRGNSLAKVSFSRNLKYKIRIHNDFCKGLPVIRLDKSNPYTDHIVNKNDLHSFLQKKHINIIISNIKKRNYSEELILEQLIISDNINRSDFIIIDRQVTDKVLKGKRMDLLGLKQVENSKYQFIVLEIKMGNNPELKIDVSNQLKGYVEHINNNFSVYKECYEKQYSQKKQLGLILNSNYEKIEIGEPADGMVVVSGYNSTVNKSLKKLNEIDPNIIIQVLKNKIDCSLISSSSNIENAFNDLTYKFMSMFLYKNNIENNKIINKPMMADDMKFFEQNPDHSLASENRFVRINAADTIQQYCSKKGVDLNKYQLNQLHRSLFDCCAPVRHSIAITLKIIGDNSSKPLLELLNETENESEMVKFAVKDAINAF
jgi:hypothetical protein